MSDTTPLFLFGLALFRCTTGESNLLTEAAERALNWMAYQSPDDSGMIAQQPTSDWRDEQWVLGYRLFVNTITYANLRLFGLHDQADSLRSLINQPTDMQDRKPAHVHEGLALPDRPYYVLWSNKVHGSDRFDLLGNSLAILAGIASPAKAEEIVAWIEAECQVLRARGDLAAKLEVPPCLIPFIRPGDLDWHPRYKRYNQPGGYHDGGVWSFAVSFYIAALVSIGKVDLAREKLTALTALCQLAREADVPFGFNEWLCAQDGTARGQDWATWTAALYLYAAAAVEQNRVSPFPLQLPSADFLIRVEQSQ
jgi:hypothetical protein